MNTRKKVVVLRSDGTKRVLALYEILDKIPKEIEFISFKSKCQLTKVDIPTKEELETKELSIITTAIRILSDEENILVTVVMDYTVVFCYIQNTNVGFNTYAYFCIY